MPPRLWLLPLFIALLAGCSSEPDKPKGGGDGGSAVATTDKPAADKPAAEPEQPAPKAPFGDEETEALRMMLATDFDKAMVEYERLMAARAPAPIADYYWQRYMEAADYADDDVTEEIVRATDRLLPMGLHPALEARARDYRMLVARGKAKLDDAEKEAVALGFVRDWFVCGPFENESETGFKNVYGPEKELSLDREYEGKLGKYRFFQSAARARFGTVDMAQLFRLNSDVCAYAAAFVKSESTRPVAVRLGSDGAAKVWVNGKLALESDCYRQMGLDQDAAGAVLEKGWNVILVKVCQKGGGEDTKDLTDETWEFAVRLTEPGGKALAGIETEGDLAKAKGLKLSEPSGGEVPVVDKGAEGRFLSSVKADPEDASSRARLAFLKMKRHALDENDRGARDLLREAAKLAGDEPTILMWLSEAEDTKNKKLDAIQRAMAVEPKSALVRWLDGEQHAGHIDDKAEARFREALELRKGLVLARMSLAEVFSRRGGPWVNEARAIYKEIVKDFPDHGIAKAYLARLSEARPGEQEKYLEERLASWGLDPSVRNMLKNIYRRKGEFDRAVALMDDRLALDPYDVMAHLEAGLVYESQGLWDKALERYGAALRISPENNAAILAAANACVAAGRNEEAIAYLTQSLAIRPNQPDASKRLRSLKPKEKEFWRGYESDLAPHIERAKNVARSGDESATYVFKHDLVVVAENGTASYFTQQVIKIFDERGAQSYRAVSALGGHFDTFGGGRAEFKTARRIQPDGTVREGTRREGSWWAGFENLSAGDVLVVEFQMEETGEPRYKGYFGLMLPLQPEFDPVQDARITLVHPEGKAVYHEAVRFTANPEIAVKDGKVCTVWEVKGIPHVPQEPNMPPFYETIAYIHFSTFKTWADVGEWFSGLVRDRFEASDEIKDAVKKSTAASKSRLEKIEALYQLLVSRTRYEALDLDNHAYLPFKASETFARQYGDCKDTATLFVTMMKEAGEEANLVLVRTNDMGVIDLSLPSMKVFNHCIAYVPDRGDGKGMFIDGTARYYSAKDLPSMDQGAVMFVVRTGDKAAAQVTDWVPPEMNSRDSTITVKLNADGSATIIQKATVNGMDAGMMRQRFQAGAKREKLFQEWYNQFFDAVEVDKLSFNDLADYNLPVEFQAEIRVPRFARKEGRSIVFRPSMFPARLAEQFGQLADRKHDVVLDFPQERKERVVFELPKGWKVKSLPASLERDNTLGAFSWKAKAEGNRIEVDSSMSLKKARVPKGDYKMFRDFAVDVDKAQEEEIVIEPER